MPYVGRDRFDTGELELGHFGRCSILRYGRRGRQAYEEDGNQCWTGIQSARFHHADHLIASVPEPVKLERRYVVTGERDGTNQNAAA
jgi:hypothetical protein